MCRIGLLAGNDNLPVLFAQAAVKAGIEVVVIALTEGAKVGQLETLTDKVYKIDVGQLEKIITTLQTEEVKEVVMLGKVTKELLYQEVKLDQRFKNLLANLENNSDDNIMLAIVEELKKEGIKPVKQLEFIYKLLAPAGTLTNTEPTKKVLADMNFAFKMAKEIGRLDIGQTVVVKDKAVMAVEAIEGTNQAILRGGDLAQTEAVVAKVSKPKQDLRFDIPTIGLKTIENLKKIGAKGIVIEAEKTFIVNQKEVVAKADEAGISIVAMDGKCS